MLIRDSLALKHIGKFVLCKLHNGLLIMLRNVFANEDKEYLVNFLRLVTQLLKRLPPFSKQQYSW